MQKINTMIVLMSILVASSGAYLGFLIYQQNNQQNLNPDNDTQANNPRSDDCIDEDEDGYGQNCAKGKDCDDNDYELNLLCKVNGKLNLSSDKTEYKVGDEISLDIIINGIASNTEPVDVAIVNLEYSSQDIQFIETTDAPKGLLYALNKDGQIHLANVDDSALTDGDRLATYKFKALRTGDIKVSIAKIPKQINGLYDIDLGEITLNVVE